MEFENEEGLRGSAARGNKGEKSIFHLFKWGRSVCSRRRQDTRPEIAAAGGVGQSESGRWYTLSALEYLAQLGRFRSAPPSWSQPQGDRLKKIFAGNLDPGIAQESIGEALDKFGAVERMGLVRERDKGARRGFAFIEMTASEAWTA